MADKMITELFKLLALEMGVTMENTINTEQWLQSLSGVEFEKVCGQLIVSMGFSVEYTKISGDGGIDIIARNTEPLLQGKYIIQCKRYSGNVGEPVIRDLLGVVTKNHANKGILITTGGFSNQAKEFASGFPIELIDGEKLVNLIQASSVFDFVCGVTNTDEIAEILGRISLIGKEEYIACRKRYEQDQKSISGVGMLVNFLFVEALKGSYGSEIGIYIPERRKILEEVNRLLCLFDDRSPATEKNKNDSVKLCVCKLIHAQTCFLLGDYQKTKQIYHNILEWKELSHSLSKKNGLVDLFWNVTFDMCSFYSSINEKSIASRWLEHPSISQMLFWQRSILLSNHQKKMNIQVFNSEMEFDKYYQDELKDLDDILVDPCLHPVEILYDFFDSESLHDPILNYYNVPVRIIRSHFFNGDYKVKGNESKGYDVWFVYSTVDDFDAWELIVSS